MQVDRRSLLIGAGAAALSPVLPQVAFAAPPSLPFLPAFAVGSPGEYNWKILFAQTAERARELWFIENGDPVPLPGEDARIHAMALTLRGWLPGDLLLGTVERALREALKVTSEVPK